MIGLLLFAHGARDPDWARPFQSVAQQIATLRPGLPVELAFLEFMSPDLPEAGTRLVAAGCAQVHVVPLFLGSGGHVRRDVPRLIEQMRSRAAHVQWHLHSPVGEHPAVLLAMATASLELIAPGAPA